jgi:hypothetical protein
MRKHLFREVQTNFFSRETYFPCEVRQTLFSRIRENIFSVKYNAESPPSCHHLTFPKVTGWGFPVYRRCPTADRTWSPAFRSPFFFPRMRGLHCAATGGIYILAILSTKWRTKTHKDTKGTTFCMSRYDNGSTT